MKSEPPREEALFQAASQLTSSSRAAFLDQACASDVALRQRLDALLAAHEETAGVLAHEPVREVLPSTIDLPESVPDETVGMTLGRYKLREKLGEGGCGTVYVAEQTEPVRRAVALKVIKLGMDTKLVVARFEAERQALAMMDHPNIAKVLDAGTTDVGRPYFVMELVRGIRITDYCDQAQLPTEERLELFIKVCHAIQHAHQKGIIHRDIKPSNILVTLHDGVPVPKVIDFGIAKATEGRLTDNTVYTQLHQFMGTPAYMSPEQAEMSGLDIDTRSDIYSLGVLLYQLLTSKTPFDGKELLALGIDEMRRTIREEEPMRPSTRLATLGADQLTTTAKRRSADAPKLLHQLKGDLDWIVMKCLEKDRSRRYDTANGLAADIKRHLANQPVVACPPSAGYKFRKFARRHKAALAVSAAFAGLLVAATAASTWQAIRATRAEAQVQKRVLEVAAERDAKERARQEAEAISAFLTQLFESPDPSRDRRTITVVEILDQAVRKLDRHLETEPARRAQLQYTLGRTYLALGLDLDAIPLFEKFRDYYLRAFGPEHAETLIAMHNLARCYSNVGRHAEGLKLREATWASYRKTLGALHSNTLDALLILARDHLNHGRVEEALKFSEELLRLQRQAQGPLHEKTLAAMGILASVQVRLGRLDEALRQSEELLKLRRQELGPEHRDTLRAMNTLASLYNRMGRTNEAINLSVDALAIKRSTRGPESLSALISMHSLAVAYAQAGRLEDARKLCEELLEISRKVRGPEHRDTLKIMNTLAMIHRKTGRVVEAIQLAESSLELHRRIVGPISDGTLEAMTELATAHQIAGHFGEAITLEVESLQLKRQHHPFGRAAMIASLENLAACYEQSNQKPEADTLRQELAGLRAETTATIPDSDRMKTPEP